MPQRQLTLRQIEVIRAIMVAGSIAGAARLLNVSQPGLSRTMKHVESMLKIKLFARSGGKYTPSPEAQSLFAQLNEVYQKLNDLQFAIGQLERGLDVEFAFGSVPSLAHAMVPRAIRTLRTRYPQIHINLETLKIEEAVDYLLLGRGEFVCMSYRFEHPAIQFQPLAAGELRCLVHGSHPLAEKSSVSARDIARYPLIGINPNDPYGGILTGIFKRQGLAYEMVIRVRFGSMIIKLVKQNLGVAVLDNFTLADLGVSSDELRVIPIDEETPFETYVAFRRDVELSSFAETFVDELRAEMARYLKSGE